MPPFLLSGSHSSALCPLPSSPVPIPPSYAFSPPLQFLFLRPMPPPLRFPFLRPMPLPSDNLHELGRRESVIPEEVGSELSRGRSALAVAGRIPGHQRELRAGQRLQLRTEIRQSRACPTDTDRSMSGHCQMWDRNRQAVSPFLNTVSPFI